MQVPIRSLGRGFGKHGEGAAPHLLNPSGFRVALALLPGRPAPKGDSEPTREAGAHTCGGAVLCALVCLGVSSMCLPQTAR